MLVTIEVFYREGKVGEQSMDTGVYDDHWSEGCFEFSPEKIFRKEFDLGRFLLKNAHLHNKEDRQLRFHVSDFELRKISNNDWVSYASNEFNI